MPSITSNSRDVSGNSQLTHWILDILRSDGQPLGAGSLGYLLQKRGSSISAPTIGRKLRDMEQQGLLQKIGVDGRILTAAGKNLLAQLDREHHIEASAQQFLKLLKRNSRKDIVDQLVARRTIEAETAGLAADRVSTAGIKKLEAIVEKQRAVVDSGESGVEEDIKFHTLIGELSENPILSAMVRLLRSEGWLNHVMVAIRSRVGTRFVVDHEEILKAIRARNASAARQAMEGHIDRLVADVDRYWDQVYPKR